MSFDKSQIMDDEEIKARLDNICAAKPCERIYTCFICEKPIDNAKNGLGSILMMKLNNSYVPVHDSHAKSMVHIIKSIKEETNEQSLPGCENNPKG